VQPVIHNAADTGQSGDSKPVELAKENLGGMGYHDLVPRRKDPGLFFQRHFEKQKVRKGGV